MNIQVGGKEYEVDPRVNAALDGEGIKYFTGYMTDEVAVTEVAVMKRTDPNFEEVFMDMYDTVEGEVLLRTGEDYSGLNEF